jgi:hypothetical protein
MTIKKILILLFVFFSTALSAWARNLEYNGQEAPVYVSPGEPTNIKFPDKIAGGYITNDSSIQLQREGSDLIIFTSGQIKSQGEAIIVRLKDKRSFSLRLLPTSDINPRDPMVSVDDMSENSLEELREEDDDSKSYEPQDGKYAPPTVLSGFMREMVLFSEFGKPKIQGYEVSSKHRGETIFHDGTMHAKINSIFIGAKYWGYVIDTENLLDTNQLLNPGTFRLDGTRAVSANRWELAAKPLTNEQELAGRHKTKLYIITKPR